MHRTKLLLATLTLVVATGCGEDMKQRISMLEEENRTLYGDIEKLRNETDEAKRQRDLCQSNLLKYVADGDHRPEAAMQRLCF